MRHWLLELTVGGEVFRRTDASDALVVTTAAGVELVYEPGLAELVTSRPSTLEVSIGLTIEDETAWHTYGADIEEGTAALRRWTEGDAWEQAELIAEGWARDVEWGEPGEGLALTLSTGASDSDPLLSPQARIDAATFPTGDLAGSPYVPEDADGVPYLLVFGYPGHAPALGGPWTVVPVVQPERAGGGTDRIFLSEGLIDAGVVSISDGELNNFAASDLDVAAATDLLGRRFSYCDFQADASLRPAAAQRVSFYAGFQADPSYGGGMLDPYGTGVLRGAGSVIRWVLWRTCAHRRIDWEDVERSVAWFDRYLVDTWVNDPELRGLEWLDQVVLPMVPHRWVTTARGLSIRPWRWRATRAAAVAHLVAGVDIDRASSCRVYSAGDRWNEITVRYRPMRSQAAWRSSRTLTAQPGRLTRTPGAGEDSRVLASPIAAAAQRREVVPTTRDLAAVWDDSTALRIAEDMLVERGLPHTATTYQAQSDAWERLQVADVVLITDEALGYDARVVLVDDVPLGAETGPALAFVLPHPLCQ